MSNTRTPAAKKAVAKPVAEVTPIAEAEPMDPVVQALLDEEQNRLNSATMQAQLSYLSVRVGELTQENYDLRQELNG